MPALSWNEIRQRAIQFSRNWADVVDERAEAQSFWNDFFEVFGKQRRLLATFEEKVKSLKGTHHYIDLFWPGRLLAEHKSAGRPLDKAESQAFQYIAELASSNREEEIPQYVILSDFRRIVLYDLEAEEGKGTTEFFLEDFHQHIKNFAFFIGQKTHHFGEEDPANLKAASIMADLHDAMEEGNYTGEELERLLVRLLFCLFAEDTGIFDTAQFELFIENHTQEDGRDLGAQLNHLFEILDTPTDRRSKYLDEDLAEFPYINGELFTEKLRTADFNPHMRNRILAACHFDWSRISPAIFGSLFQGIMDNKERRQIGAHYTSERDILKLIRPLFLDELHAEFAKIMEDSRKGHRDTRLKEFREKLTKLRFLDPACGCGNFLVVAYRELRKLEHQILDAIYDFKTRGEELALGEAGRASRIDVNQFYGIEIGEWPARIAETALWLTDHQMNIALSRSTGNLYQRIPLKASPHIQCANALRMDWNDLLPAAECSYVLGNPPFVGAKFQSKEQKADVQSIAGKVKGNGLLDYVCLWYFKAVQYIEGTSIRCAFVSTNSISQGEQVGVLWSALFNKGAKIHFAHRTFSWQSEAKGKAHVHVVIIGFATHDTDKKQIFEYDDIKAEPAEQQVSNLSPYLIEAGDVAIVNRSRPFCDVPEIGIGNKPIDGGNYLFEDEEKTVFLQKEPDAENFFRPWIGSREFLYGYHRWCLWLGDAPAHELRHLPECIKRIEAVQMLRKASKSPSTQKLSETPRRFHVENFPEGNFLVIPKVSSEKRNYIPIGYLESNVLVSDLCFISKNATLYHFGILTSAMHMAWVRQVCGRLKSDYRYSAKLVYNNFPWPTEVTEAQQEKVTACAQAVLDVRQGYLDKNATLADLYDPLCMPAPLLKAHQTLDRAVDQCYRSTKFDSERERVEFLFQRYECLTAPLKSPITKKKTAKKKCEA